METNEVVDLEREIQFFLNDLDATRKECKEYKIKFNKPKKKIVKIKSQIEGSKEREIKLKKAKDEIAKLKANNVKTNSRGMKLFLKIQIEEGKMIVDYLDSKIRAEIDECYKVEEDIVTLRKELENAKEKIYKSLKIKGDSDIL